MLTMNFLEGVVFGFLVIVGSVLYASPSSKVGKWIVRVLMPVLATAVFTLDLMYSVITLEHFIAYPEAHAVLFYIAVLGCLSSDSPLEDHQESMSTREAD